MIGARKVRIARLGDKVDAPSEAFMVAGFVLTQASDEPEPAVFLPPPTTRTVTMYGEFRFRSSVEWLRCWQLIAGVKPSIKYGERKWGAFA